MGEEPNLAGLALRFDSSFTAAYKGESYRLVDIFYDVASKQNVGNHVGSFVTKPRSALVDWVDAENAVFRSRVNRRLKTGVLVRPAMSVAIGTSQVP